MATAIKVWEIVSGSLNSVVSDDLAAQHVEAELETWITRNPEILGDKILLIDRQRNIPGVGKFDLLGIDESGSLVIIELKRSQASREAVAQALDYAAWLDSESPETIAGYAQQFLQRPLAEAFLESFDTELPDLVCQNHRVLLVAARLDSSAERIISYLAERHGVDINAVFFQYAKLSDGKEILARSLLVEDRIPPIPPPVIHPTLEQLLAMADERMTMPLVEVCRQMRDVWEETRYWTFGGSFRYWTSPPAGRKMVFGINVAGKDGPGAGQLDAWIPFKSLADAIGVADTTIKDALTDAHPVRKMAVEDCWLRLKTVEDAQKLIGQLKQWAAQAARVTPA